MSTKEKISLEEAAAFLECTRERVVELLGDGRLPGIKAGKAWVIPRQSFYSLVNDVSMENAKGKARLIAEMNAAAGRPRSFRSV